MKYLWRCWEGLTRRFNKIIIKRHWLYFVFFCVYFSLSTYTYAFLRLCTQVFQIWFICEQYFMLPLYCCFCLLGKDLFVYFGLKVPYCSKCFGYYDEFFSIIFCCHFSYFLCSLLFFSCVMIAQAAVQYHFFRVLLIFFSWSP